MKMLDYEEFIKRKALMGADISSDDDKSVKIVAIVGSGKVFSTTLDMGFSTKQMDTAISKLTETLHDLKHKRNPCRGLRTKIAIVDEYMGGKMSDLMKKMQATAFREYMEEHDKRFREIEEQFNRQAQMYIYGARAIMPRHPGIYHDPMTDLLDETLESQADRVWKSAEEPYIAPVAVYNPQPWANIRKGNRTFKRQSRKSQIRNKC